MKWLAIVFVWPIVMLSCAGGDSPAQHKVTLKWNAVTNCTSTCEYKIYRGTATITPFQIAGPITPITYVDSNVVATQTYKYYVETFDPKTQLQSGPSNEVEVTVP